jgi:hypothetical protein
LRLEMLYGLFFQFKLLKVGIIFAFINAMSWFFDAVVLYVEF